MPIDPSRFLETVDASEAAESAKVTELVDVFGASRLIREDFNRNALLQCSRTVGDLEKCIKSLSGPLSQGIFDNLWSKAYNAGSVTSGQIMTVRDLFRFKSWLQSPSGEYQVRALQQKSKLTKSGKDKFSAEDMALKRLYTAEYEDRTRELSDKQGKRDTLIAQLKAKIDQARRAYEREEAIVRAKYPISSSYSEPTSDVVKAKCWEMYLAECNQKGVAPVLKTGVNLDLMYDKYNAAVRDTLLVEYLRRDEVKDMLHAFGVDKIKRLRTDGNEKLVNTFVASWKSRVERQLLRYPMKVRRMLLEMVPVGKIPLRAAEVQTRPLRNFLNLRNVLTSTTAGTIPKPPLPRSIASAADPASLLRRNARIRAKLRDASLRDNAIPMGRSKWEAGVRHIIGGGELKSWRTDNKKYRGGGHLYDALLLLANADDTSPFSSLSESLSPDGAREILCLPSGLAVPDGPRSCVMKQFNDEATAGPLLRAFGIKGKYGLKAEIESFVWDMYNMVGEGMLNVEQLPCLLSRVGYRSKLLDQDVAFEKMKEMKPLGRAVMMLDATEQAFSSPLFNVISGIVTELNCKKESGWRNYLVRASSSWGELWEEVKASGTIVELDWSKFDRERPRQDIQFFIDVIISCFTAKTMRERRLLNGYKRMMENALIFRVMVLDNGGYFTLDGMVPSGSLWTGVCDTALNIMYITSALLTMGFDRSEFSPKCAGDDNLTLFRDRIPERQLYRLRRELNSMYRAGIDKEDFFIHYPPFHVYKEQACFPPGTELKGGTSKLMDEANWVAFEGELIVDEARGMSHRWEYRFAKRPKFLANYFLPDGRPIRPAHDNLSRLLWPEGIHESLDDYVIAVMAMIVDNPFNHHNVNHMMVRYIIAQQLRRITYDVDPALAMELCCLRDRGGGPVPYPVVGYWRRGGAGNRFEHDEEFKHVLANLREFIATVSTLYARKSEGGIDSWRFMEILRGEHSIGAGQFGNDIHEWCRFLGGNPLTKSLKAARRFHPAKEHPVADPDTLAKAKAAFRWCRDFCVEHPIVGPIHFASEVCNILLE
ncbi:TPA_asm: fusion protein [Alloteropsis semialata amalgavirus 1]|nr:TPA_asm: fusion protein [Alloteropsis semialata amalgavirus 1]